MSKQNQSGIRRLAPFWLLLAVCGLPYLLSWVYFLQQDSMPVANTSNRGQLIEPVQSVAELQLTDIKGTAMPVSQFQNNWSLLAVTGADCARECQQKLYFLRQVRRLMGEDRKRIQRNLLMLESASPTTLQGLDEHYSNVQILNSAAVDRERLLQQLSMGDTSVNHNIFIIDPLGNLMMRYPADAQPTDIAKDLRRLLKVSRIGDIKQPEEMTSNAQKAALVAN